MSIEDGPHEYDQGYAQGWRDGEHAATCKAAERRQQLEAELAQARETIRRLQRQVPEPWHRPEES